MLTCSVGQLNRVVRPRLREAKASSERAVAEGLRQELVRTQIRAESLASLEKALADSQDQLKSVKDAIASAQQTAAVSEARTAAASERAEQAEAREAALRAETAQLRDQVAKGHVSTQQLAATLAKVSADLAAAVERQKPIKKVADDIAAAALQARGQNTADTGTS